MKIFEEMNNPELSELTGEQINHYCDLACAEFGAPLLPPRPIQPEKVEIPGELMLVEVGDWYFSPEDGAKVMATLATVKLYKRENWEKSYYGKLIDPHDYNYPDMKGQQMLTESQYDQHREALAFLLKAHPKLWEAEYANLLTYLYPEFDAAIMCVGLTIAQPE